METSKFIQGSVHIASDEGWDAHLDGISRNKNPYAPDSAEWAAWNKGYDAHAGICEVVNSRKGS